MSGAPIKGAVWKIGGGGDSFVRLVLLLPTVERSRRFFVSEGRFPYATVGPVICRRQMLSMVGCVCYVGLFPQT